ncbi:hypothetical protein NE237_000276 [Protea cynaroides]|uniref:Uncharacterized protein n=1 Tax=Protea cynaroides TaxID=273540 RepID=A0A9Q0KR70_9MAGN|nr:hypothetical protein NE237_000276 [Protea cynaroides]
MVGVCMAVGAGKWSGGAALDGRVDIGNHMSIGSAEVVVDRGIISAAKHEKNNSDTDIGGGSKISANIINSEKGSWHDSSDVDIGGGSKISTGTTNSGTVTLSSLSTMPKHYLTSFGFNPSMEARDVSEHVHLKCLRCSDCAMAAGVSGVSVINLRDKRSSKVGLIHVDVQGLETYFQRVPRRDFR